MDIQKLSRHAVRLGGGKQGTVYRISPDRCVKIYKSKDEAAREAEAYNRAEGSWLIPKRYEAGPRYMIMEYLDGETMQDYLRRKGVLTREDTVRILEVLQEMKRLEFSRIDAALFHLFVGDSGRLQIIDLVNAYTKKYSTPRVLLKGLSRLELLVPFLEHVKELDYELYVRFAKTSVGKE